MPTRLRSSFMGSIAAHIAVVALALFARSRIPATVVAPAPGIDVEMLTPPPPVAVRAPPVEPPLPLRPPDRTPQPSHVRSAHRSVPSPLPIPTSEPLATAPEPTPPPTELAPVPAPQPAPRAPTTRILTAADLYSTTDSMAIAAARAGGVDLGHPNGGYRPSRDLFGQPHDGRSLEERTRDIASAPTMAALADSNHMVPAGSGEHDHRVARRAEEAFLPARTVANIGAAVLRAPMVSLPAIQHVQSGGESAAASELDMAHGQSFTMMSAVTVPPPPVHTLRAEIEVDQDRAGTVLATRVVHPSGMAAYDEAAVRAIREAIPEVTALQLHEGRRTRWSFEVSESVGPVGTLLGGGNEGWRMIPEQSNGVRLRYRVRRVSTHPLQGT